ncbi:50S ribosomal protein L9 [Candidatus Dependentiae bacterium]|nr:50S ribosomal protein L9 [Candidatus Dependentiae bacterium]
MKVFLLKDVEKVGFAGTIVKVSEGYGRNFLIARKLALEVTPENEGSFENKVKMKEVKKEVIETKTSMLAEKIKSLEIAIKRKMHDGEKLYGAISSQEVVELLSEKGISVQKNQVIFDKSIKTVGKHDIIIKLSSKLQPKFTLKVSPLA